MKRSVKIKVIEPLPDRVLSVQFDDGRRVLFEPAPFLADIAGYDVFRVAPKLFSSAKLDKGRMNVCWTEAVFVPAELIYAEGRIIEE